MYKLTYESDEDELVKSSLEKKDIRGSRSRSKAINDSNLVPDYLSSASTYDDLKLRTDSKASAILSAYPAITTENTLDGRIDSLDHKKVVHHQNSNLLKDLDETNSRCCKINLSRIFLISYLFFSTCLIIACFLLLLKNNEKIEMLKQQVVKQEMVVNTKINFVKDNLEKQLQINFIEAQKPPPKKVESSLIDKSRLQNIEMELDIQREVSTNNVKVFDAFNSKFESMSQTFMILNKTCNTVAKRLHNVEKRQIALEEMMLEYLNKRSI